MTEQLTSRPVVTNAGDGLRYGYYAMWLEEMLPAEASAGALNLTKATLGPGNTPPPLHIHTREDEFFLVLSGKIRFWVGATTLEECEVHDIGPGGVAFGPRGIPHTFDTVTPQSEVLVGLMPGWAEGYFKSIGESADRDDNENQALLEQYGMQIVGPPPSLHPRNH